MKRTFNYPKHIEKEKRIPRLTKKRIQMAEVSLGDFTGKLKNELLNWFSTTPQHWIMLHMNTIIDPYHDWVMEERTLNEFIDLKYPDNNLLLESTHHSDTTYGDVDPSANRFFVKGEVIKEYQADGTLLNGTGTVVDFDATLIQLTYKLTDNAFDTGAFVKGDDSGAVGKIATGGVTTERAGVHHYESADGIIVGRSHTGASEITNETFENNENEKKREVMVLDGMYLQQFEQNFEELMNA